MISFFRKQHNHIALGVKSVFFRKMRNLFFLPYTVLVFYFPVFLFLVLIRLIRPIIRIRVGLIVIGRIGGVYIGDRYLIEKLDGKHRGLYYDIFFLDKSIGHVNRQWMKMWKQVLPVAPGIQMWRNLVRLNSILPGTEWHKIPDLDAVYPSLEEWREHKIDTSGGIIKKYNERLVSILKNKKPNLKFNTDEEAMGREALDALGLSSDAKYMCFHARDSAYLDRYGGETDFSYHNYRDSNIKNYLGAAEEMVRRGYFAIRMGSVNKDALDSCIPGIIDYPFGGFRTDFNDIYIGSHCRFFLGSDTGMAIIPEMFRIPAVYVNWTDILRISTWVLNGLFIFKKFYLKNEKRFMNFTEIMNLEFGPIINDAGNYTNKIFSELDLELLENTPDEIGEVTIEMDERLNGTWVTTEKDEELQKRFWALFGPDKLKSKNLRIGANYLRQNMDLLN